MPQDDRASENYWSKKVVEQILSTFPDKKVYTCAAGISPSGIVHFGNFRDVMTSYVVAGVLKRLGKKSRLIYSWDDFDRFRKVPKNVPSTFEEHIGKPLSGVPDPFKCHESYAKHFETEFIESGETMGLEIEHIFQTEKYTHGDYDEHIVTALNKRKEIAEILYSFMSEKGIRDKNIEKDRYIEEFYPVRIYSRFSGKDNTEILGYDGIHTITYKCHDTNKEESFDFTKDHIVKLSWKTDWAMRWMYENVTFEPGGPDHAAPGSSFLVSSAITKKIFNNLPPEFIEYKFVGLQGQGSKMSGSKGNAITPLELLDIYQPSLLKWLYLRKNPNQSFSIALNTEIYRQYDEFDRTVDASLKKKLPKIEELQLQTSFEGTSDKKHAHPIPMRLAVGLGQIVQWDIDKVNKMLRALDTKYDRDSISARLAYAKAWLEKYNPDEMISLLSSPNVTYWKTMSEDAKARVQKLSAALTRGMSDIKELEKLVYDIPKDVNLSQQENVPLQRAFFKDVYQLLIGKDTGPRLSTFLWAVDRTQVLKLLDI